MGMYVYTARATGRLPARVNGEVHQIFPMEYSFKPWWSHPRNDVLMSRAQRQADSIEKRPDWTGYVVVHGGVYKTDSALWFDTDPLGEYVGEIYAGPNGAEVR